MASASKARVTRLSAGWPAHPATAGAPIGARCPELWAPRADLGKQELKGLRRWLVRRARDRA